MTTVLAVLVAAVAGTFLGFALGVHASREWLARATALRAAAGRELTRAQQLRDDAFDFGKGVGDA